MTLKRYGSAAGRPKNESGLFEKVIKKMVEEKKKDYNADAQGLETCYASMNEAVSSFREDGYVENGWDCETKADYENRKKT